MMNKFLNTENATITIEYSKYLEKFIKNNLYDIKTSNYKRLTIIVKDKDLLELSKILANYNFDELPIFIKIIGDNIDEKIVNKLNEKYYIVIKTNNWKIKYQDYYYELSFKNKDKDKIIKLLNKHDNIILNHNEPFTKVVKNNQVLNGITKKVKTEYLYFENNYIPVKLIIDSPYNVYLNNQNSHRDYGNNLPRNIYIDNKYIYATNIKNKNIIIGSITESLDSIYNNCKNTKGYKNFIKYNETVFIDYLNQYPFTVIDWNTALKEVIKNDTSS